MFGEPRHSMSQSLFFQLQDTVKVEYHGFAPGGVFEGEPTTSKPLNTTQICEYCRNAERNESKVLYVSDLYQLSRDIPYFIIILKM